MNLTEEDARRHWCPLTFNGRQGTCLASACMAWRWQPLMADDAYIAALVKAAAELGDKTPNRAKATTHVKANRAAYGLPERPFLGRCGIAGPEDK